jgi:hypothetical protein
MNKRILLSIVAIPTIAGSILAMMLLATEGSTTEITPTTAQTVLKVAASDRF